MDICTFNDHYLNPLLDNLSKESNKTIVLLGDFNIDPLSFLVYPNVSVLFWMIQSLIRYNPRLFYQLEYFL